MICKYIGNKKIHSMNKACRIYKSVLTMRAQTETLLVRNNVPNVYCNLFENTLKYVTLGDPVLTLSEAALTFSDFVLTIYQ